MPPARYRVAIVGAGPSGLFAAQFLAARPDIEVDIFDRLPTPYGLLRYGVAPDHTSIKSVATALARVFESPNVRFLGLVTLGRDVTRDELLAGYDAVIYAVGASEDLRMGVPGEDAAASDIHNRSSQCTGTHSPSASLRSSTTAFNPASE